MIVGYCAQLQEFGCFTIMPIVQSARSSIRPVQPHRHIIPRIDGLVLLGLVGPEAARNAVDLLVEVGDDELRVY